MKCPDCGYGWADEPTESMDVERLSKALDNLFEKRWPGTDYKPGAVTIGGAFAEDIAAEYDRLGR